MSTSTVNGLLRDDSDQILYLEGRLVKLIEAYEESQKETHRLKGRRNSVIGEMRKLGVSRQHIGRLAGISSQMVAKIDGVRGGKVVR